MCAGGTRRGIIPACRVTPSQGSHDQHGVPGDRNVKPGPRNSSRPKLSLPARKLSSAGQHSPAARISRVAERQLAGLEVAADEQVVPREGGGQPRTRRTHAGAWSPSGRGHLLAAGGRLAAASAPASFPAARHGHAEVPRDAQHVGLAAGLEAFPQLGAAAVDLIPAEIEAYVVGERLSDDVDGLPLDPGGGSALAPGRSQPARPPRTGG